MILIMIHTISLSLTSQKHGHAKANITGVCVLTDQKCNDVFPASANLIAFMLEKSDYLVVSVETNNETGVHKFSCLTEENDEVEFFSNPNQALCKGNELATAYNANPDKNWSVIVIRAPVATEGGEDSFRDEELIESFRESKE